MAQFRQDKMTEKERWEALLNRQPVDRVTFDVMAFALSAAMTGYSTVDVYEDPEKAFWAQIPMGDPGTVSVGHEVDLDTASGYFPNDILMGNVEPAIVQTGTPEEVYEHSRICIEKGKNIVRASYWLQAVNSHPRHHRTIYG